MHILLIHQNFATLDEPGGTATTSWPATWGRATGHHRHQPDRLSDRGGQGQPPKMGRITLRKSPRIAVRILRAYMYPALHRSFVHRVFSFLSFMFASFWVGLRIRGVDVVWGTSPPIFQGATAWAIARLKRIPFVFEVRDLWPAFAVQVGVLRQPLLIRLSEWLERFLYRHADWVVVNSPGFVDHVRRRGARVEDPQWGR
jgi:hypothetical protein